MISIIIPVYNVEKYLPQCVDSILAQTYQDFEVILVDDGSPDGSPAICNEYAQKDARVRVIHQPNAGVSAARNNGMSVAKGDWISFVDSDDWVDSDYLANFKMEEDDADLIIQGLEYYDHRNNKFFKQVRVNDCVLEDNQNFKQLIADNNLLLSGYPVAKAYRSSLFDGHLKFDTLISYHEDHIFALEAMAASKKIRLSDSISYKYRYYHTNNTLSTKRHPWQKLNIAADGMISCIKRMSDRFLVEGSACRQKVFNFAYAPKITAVFDLFQQDISDSERKDALSTIIDRSDLQKYYNPNSAKDKVVKVVLQKAPYIITKLFFTAYIKYQQRH